MRELAPKIEASPPSLDGLLALKGVIEIGDTEEREDERRSAETAVIAGFVEALGALGEMRRHEGAALGRVLSARLERNRGARRARRAGARPQARSDPRPACRADRDAARAIRAFRSRSAASGSDHDRDQGRRARGTRSPRRACRASAASDRAGRPDRPPARFSRAGVQPRSQHACAPRRTMSNSRISDWSSKPRSSSSASRCRTWNRRRWRGAGRNRKKWRGAD